MIPANACRNGYRKAVASGLVYAEGWALRSRRILVHAGWCLDGQAVVDPGFTEPAAAYFGVALDPDYMRRVQESDHDDDGNGMRGRSHIQSACRGQASRVSTTSGGLAGRAGGARRSGPGRTAAAGPARQSPSSVTRPTTTWWSPGRVHRLDRGSRPRSARRPGSARRTATGRPGHAGELVRAAWSRRSGPGRCWPSASTLAPKWPGRGDPRPGGRRRPGQNSTSGGSRDSAANDWQANPAGPSASTS